MHAKKNIVAALFLVVLLAVARAEENRSYTLFKQCNSAWANQPLGNYGGNTICSAGCLVSSVAMVLNTYGLTTDGQSTNPGTLNTWLQSHSGFVQGDLFVWASVNPLGLHFSGFANQENLRQLFDQGKNVILNVHNGGHWVLLNGYNGNTLSVNDPGYNTNSYQLSEVVTAGVYDQVRMTVLEEIFTGRIVL